MLKIEEILAVHEGGKISTYLKTPIQSKADLALVYTPGVAKVCELIYQKPEEVYNYTIKNNTIAVVTDGSAILGLGNLGPKAALPVMEGKAALFKSLGGVNAFPICLDTQDSDEIIKAVKLIAPGFAGINLEDISAPRCFEIERRLKEELDIPVFHDDQYGTAVVTLSALLNAVKVVGKKLEEIKVVMSGAGAAGTACTNLLLAAGVKNIIVCDTQGAIYSGRTENMNWAKEELATRTNPNCQAGSLKEVLVEADVLIGVSGPNLLQPEDLQVMKARAIVFAMSNPTPEVDPEGAWEYVEIVATGRSDFPNQINNVLCFPGLFKGLVENRIKDINEAMLLRAAGAIAGLVSRTELNARFIIPDALDLRVAEAVARAVVGK